ncbi:methyltransferase domain-containing protein [Nocardioides dongxiaopingii]|uniref:class I SAM-dependent methyltransferase n=1 Tax=Nocardioides sp. S-1144 TaxID=2582905 RepID=UPI00110D65F5|nr:class I SAM-dependent methyltransferase [Nocardioides sp. S-1144]QCW49663.1 methyltransferase domain-containing protein [Nocardioides sp. S-1144]
MRLPGLRPWSDDPLWASVYDWSVEHPIAGGALWRVGIHSDLRRLHDAAGELSLLPAGTRVLDVPCGGGVALRGVTVGQGLDYVAADIAPAMLERTMDSARRRGLEDQVEPRLADVGNLPFDDASFDRVVSFIGLHCFPDPARAVVEMVRVLRPGGVLTGSAVLNDTGIVHEPLRRVGRLAGLIGPSCTGPELLGWLRAEGVRDPVLELSGAIGYFRGVKG